MITSYQGDLYSQFPTSKKKEKNKKKRGRVLKKKRDFHAKLYDAELISNVFPTQKLN